MENLDTGGGVDVVKSEESPHKMSQVVHKKVWFGGREVTWCS